jgi:hypothetical protein
MTLKGRSDDGHCAFSLFNGVSIREGDMSESKTISEGVHIPEPIALPAREGVDSLVYNGRPILTRLNSRDIPFLDEECALLGVTRAHFIRWCALHACIELRRKRTGMTREVTL